jgi:hypothetical protein
MNRTVLVNVNLEDNYSYMLDKAFQEVDEIINQNNNQGYKVVSVTPLTASGKYTEYTIGYGYSFTTGILIVFEKLGE